MHHALGRLFLYYLGPPAGARTLSKTMASRAVPSPGVDASERCSGPSRRVLSAFSSASSVSDTLALGPHVFGRAARCTCGRLDRIIYMADVPPLHQHPSTVLWDAEPVAGKFAERNEASVKSEWLGAMAAPKDTHRIACPSKQAEDGLLTLLVCTVVVQRCAAMSDPAPMGSQALVLHTLGPTLDPNPPKPWLQSPGDAARQLGEALVQREQLAEGREALRHHAGQVAHVVHQRALLRRIPSCVRAGFRVT